MMLPSANTTIGHILANKYTSNIYSLSSHFVGP